MNMIHPRVDNWGGFRVANKASAVTSVDRKVKRFVRADIRTAKFVDGGIKAV